MAGAQGRYPQAAVQLPCRLERAAKMVARRRFKLRKPGVDARCKGVHGNAICLHIGHRPRENGLCLPRGRIVQKP